MPSFQWSIIELFHFLNLFGLPGSLDPWQELLHRKASALDIRRLHI